MKDKFLYITTQDVEVFSHIDGRIINITDLRKHLEDSKIEIKFSGIPIDNVEGMIANHEWDANHDQRAKALVEHMAATKTIPPLICLTPGDQQEGMTVSVIDGWHTLGIIFMVAKGMGLPLVKFHAYWVTNKTIEPFIVPKENTCNMRVPPAGAR